MGIGASLAKAFKSLTKSKFLFGATTGTLGVVTLNSITSGGLVTSTANALGVDNTAASIMLIFVIGLGIYLVFRYLDSRIPARFPGGRRK